MLEYYLRQRREGIKTQILQDNRNQCVILALNLNGLNSPIKIQTSRMDQKGGTISLLPPRTHLTIEGRYYLRMKGRTKVFQTNGPREQAGATVPVCDKTGFSLN